MLISKFGFGEELDLYFLYLTIPQILLSVFAAPISSFVLPALCNVLDIQKKLMQQWAYIGINLILSLLLMLTVLILGYLYDVFIGIGEKYLFLTLTLSIPSYFLSQSIMTVFHSNKRFADFEIIEKRICISSSSSKYNFLVHFC